MSDHWPGLSLEIASIPRVRQHLQVQTQVRPACDRLCLPLACPRRKTGLVARSHRSLGEHTWASQPPSRRPPSSSSEGTLGKSQRPGGRAEGCPGKAPCDSWVLEAVSPCRTQASCPPPFRDALAAQLVFLLPVAAPCEGRTVQGSDPAALGSLAQGARSDLVARSAQPPLDCCPGLCPASDCNRLQPPGLPASQGSEHISVEPCPGPTRTPPLPH